MCIPIYRHDPRSRAIAIATNLSLVAGLLLWNFACPFEQIFQLENPA
jgi:hypothetical protein